MAHKTCKSDGATFRIDRRIAGVGRLAIASGVTTRKEFRRRVDLIDRLVRDARLKTSVVRVRGVALIEYTEQHYEVRLWISPKTRLLYVAALSAEDKKKFEKFTGIFDRITSED